MSKSVKSIRFGTRGSALALWQTNHVAALLQAALPGLRIEIETFKTRGDRVLDVPLPLVGGKGLFTAELESALRAGRIDCAVHSLKDLPTDPPDGLAIGAIPPRANPADLLVCRAGAGLESLPAGARIGTSSIRRAAQLRHLRPDLVLLDIRGNVDTRIRKALDPQGDYEAIVLAFAGVDRLGLAEPSWQMLSMEEMLPAPGQGAIAVQCRAHDEVLRALALIHQSESALDVTAERAFLAALGGGCSLPVAAHATTHDGQMTLHGRVLAPDGSRIIDVRLGAAVNEPDDATELGAALAREALAQGAQGLMAAHA